MKSVDRLSWTVFPMALAGAGESGKSTLLKQMRRAFGKELSAEECMARRDIIRGNLLQAMRTLLEACVEAGVEVACDVSASAGLPS